MEHSSTLASAFSRGDSLYPQRARRLRHAERIGGAAGVIAAVIHRGLTDITDAENLELGIAVMAAMLLLTYGLWQRYRWSLARPTFRRDNRAAIVLTAVWLAGLAVVAALGHALPTGPVDRYAALTAWTEVMIVLRGIADVLAALRKATLLIANPSLILVSTFALLVLLGTLLLMLPQARAHTAGTGSRSGAPLLVALFTATSAGCVTGLVVEPTGTYWSTPGQIVILGLFQLGGLGIMTCGAFFAVAAGRHLPIREAATLRDVLESDRLGDVPRLVRSILFFTLASELVGALLICTLWSDRPPSQQIYFSLFHSVSAFCNAGFSLTADSFNGMGARWQVWGVMAGLIIIGGLGFTVLHNLALAAVSRFRSLERQPLFGLSRERVRLTLTTRLVLVATSALILAGTLAVFLLESIDKPADTDFTRRACDAWFQSITFRTAGFNTIDHDQLQPATKLVAVALMFIGASPGSTGGGVKTTCFALCVLALASILRGRQHVEVFGRSIPDVLVNRALTIMSLALTVLLTTTMLIVIFENRPELFLDHLYEAASAFGTVGVSTGITPELTDPSKLVLVVTMFLGRVGPLTLLVALAGQMREARYDYPIERVILG